MDRGSNQEDPWPKSNCKLNNNNNQKDLGQKHIKVSQFQQIKIPFQSLFLMKLKIGLKYEYSNDIESFLFFHIQFQIMML